MRTFVCAVTALLICAIGLIAAEIKGKVKSADADKKTITVTSDDGKDTEVKVGGDTKFVNAKGKDLDNEKAWKALKAGVAVVVTTDKKDGKDVVTEVKVMGGKKKDK